MPHTTLVNAYDAQTTQTYAFEMFGEGRRLLFDVVLHPTTLSFFFRLQT